MDHEIVYHIDTQLYLEIYMNQKFVLVFSGEGLSTLEQRGGTGNWVIKNDSFLHVSYVLIIRNLKQSFPDNKDGYEHGQAFLLGKYHEVKQSKEASNRKVIQISEFARLPQKNSFKNAWEELTESQRYPIAYKESAELVKYLEDRGIRLEHLHWEKMQPPQEENNLPSNTHTLSLSLADIINEARKNIAKAANVDESKVNIQISF